MSKTYDPKQNLAILRQCWIFQAVPCSDLEAVSQCCTIEFYKQGTKITQRGVSGNSLFVLGKGCVKGTLPSPNGQAEFIISMFWPGDVFGEVVLFDRAAFLGSSIAIGDVQVLKFPRKELLRLIENQPSVSLRLIGAICDQLRSALDLSLSLRFLDIASRFYQRLHYLARFESRIENGGIRIQHYLSQAELAGSIGSSREALNKVISDWKRAGFLESGRGYVVVLDPTGLADLMPESLRKDIILGNTGGADFRGRQAHAPLLNFSS